MLFMKELFVSDSLSRINQNFRAAAGKGHSAQHKNSLYERKGRTAGLFGGGPMAVPPKSQVYYLYVKRKDYDEAVAVMNQIDGQ